MLIPIHQIIFYCFTVLLIASATMMITSNNPVKAILCLVITFFSSSVLWMLMQAEFLALVLIFVYVGAVMTLFLFVVMMLRTESTPAFSLRHLPLGLLVFAMLVGTAYYVFCQNHWALSATPPTHYGADYNNVMAMGDLLFTQYLLPFEIAGALLLVGMIAAIALAFHGKKPGTKSQKITEQLKADRKDLLRIIDLS